MNAANRGLWIAIGVLLTAAGVVGVLASQGWLASVDRLRPLLTRGMVERWNGWDTWATAVTIAAGAVLALLGFLLLRAQLRGRGGASMADLNVPESTVAAPGPTAEGRLHVSTSALHRALTRDLEADRHVKHAAVKITGSREHPDLLVRLAVTPDADIGEVRQHVYGAVRRFTSTSGLQPNLSEVVVKLADRQPARVH